MLRQHISKLVVGAASAVVGFALGRISGKRSAAKKSKDK